MCGFSVPTAGQLRGAYQPTSLPLYGSRIYCGCMNPLRPRWLRTIILFLAGIGLAFGTAQLLAPVWPGFCSGATVGSPCDAVAFQSMAGYLLVGLGFLTMILGPIAGSFLDVWINGHQWETSRGTESVITNVPVVVGAIYLVVGVVIAATA
jgi:hypothetical protein